MQLVRIRLRFLETVHYTELPMKTFRQYDSLVPLTSGSFGTIYRACSSTDHTQAALKVIPKSSYNQQHGPDPSNEPVIQRHLAHPNIVRLLEHAELPGEFCLVLEWMECSLTHLLKQKDGNCTEPVKKSFMQMLMRAVAYLHGNSIMHRDVKPQNLLIDNKGILKLGDFGLARRLPCTGLSSCAGTREYRAPEMLYGSTTYNHAVDLWACGCVCAEIYTNGKVLFSTDSDIAQLGLITKILGNPVEAGWKDVEHQPDYGKIVFLNPKRPAGVKSLLRDAPDEFISLIEGFVVYNPAVRTACKEALASHFFSSDPPPVQESHLVPEPAIIS